MPLYEYQCSACDTAFEVMESISSSEKPHCPACDSGELERLIGLPAPGRALSSAATNCRGDGPPCGAPRCGRRT